MASLMKRVACATVTAVLLMGAQGAAGAQEKVKIGIVAHFSGPFAASGKYFREGIEAFVATHGAKAGGREVELVYRDVGGANPAAAKQTAQELIVNDKVVALGGFFLTPDAAAAASVIDETKTPAVIFNAAGRSLMEQSSLFVRVSPTINQLTTPAANWAIKSGAKKAYILVSDYSPGREAQLYFKERFTKLGGQVIGEDRMALNTVDYAAFIERVADAKPDVVFMFLPNGTPAASLMRAFASRDLVNKGIKVIGLAVPDDQDLGSTGDAAIGFYSTHFYALRSPTEEHQQFLAAVRSRIGADALVTFNHAEAYDGMTVLYQMVGSQAGKQFDGAAAVEAIKGFSWIGAQGPRQIDTDRNSIVSIYIRRVDKIDGKLINAVVETIPNVRESVGK